MAEDSRHAAEAATSGRPVRRDARGRIVAGSAALNPGGRPKSLRVAFLKELGDEGHAEFVRKLAQCVRDWDPETDPDIPDRVAWFLDREYPKTTKLQAEVEHTQREPVKIPVTQERVGAVAEILHAVDSAESVPETPETLQ